MPVDINTLWGRHTRHTDAHTYQHLHQSGQYVHTWFNKILSLMLLQVFYLITCNNYPYRLSLAYMLPSQFTYTNAFLYLQLKALDMMDAIIIIHVHKQSVETYIQEQQR